MDDDSDLILITVRYAPSWNGGVRIFTEWCDEGDNHRYQKEEIIYDTHTIDSKLTYYARQLAKCVIIA